LTFNNFSIYFEKIGTFWRQKTLEANKRSASLYCQLIAALRVIDSGAEWPQPGKSEKYFLCAAPLSFLSEENQT
jgi:hypothetical protein